MIKDDFERYISRLSPTLRRIAHKCNGHRSYFDEHDLFQEALEHLWVANSRGELEGKTDSYVLQGAYFHLKNYIRTSLDKIRPAPLDNLASDQKAQEEVLASNDNREFLEMEEAVLLKSAKSFGLTEREDTVLRLLLDGFTTREIGGQLGVSHVMIGKIKASIRSKCMHMARTDLGYQN